MNSIHNKTIAIVDFGGQYCHMISRRLRELEIPSVIVPNSVRLEELNKYAGLILSGGPRSVYEKNAPDINKGILRLKMPVLGICYGHQLLAKHLGAEIRAAKAEYGVSELMVETKDSLFRGLPKRQRVWMSHGDSVMRLPEGVEALASTQQCGIAAFGDLRRRFFGVQFHPEVAHTDHGLRILRNFVEVVCRLRPDSGRESLIESLTLKIREKVGDRSVFFLLSGGVDSTVAFALCARALPPERLLGLYVDTGLMRRGETEDLEVYLGKLGLRGRFVSRNESRRFFSALKGVVEPEKKREIIGRCFVDVQAEAMRSFNIDPSGWVLGQGTIYPDTIESGGTGNNTAVIKTHHNRCAEILELLERGQVVEPLADYYKDEVRELGRALGLGPALTHKWPFPGPGLAIRCLCNEHRLNTRLEEQVLPAGFTGYQGVQVPVRTVGVQGDSRTYRNAVMLQGPLDYPTLERLSTQLCNVHSAYNRVILRLGLQTRKGRHAFIKAARLTQKRVRLLQDADFIVRSTMEREDLVNSVWQFPVVLIPLSFEGGESIVLRPVLSQDGMTASFARLAPDLLHGIRNEILRLPGVDEVFLDITHKPPATIEWE